MNRQNSIFLSLLLILALSIVVFGYATGRGPLAVVSAAITRADIGRSTDSFSKYD